MMSLKKSTSNFKTQDWVFIIFSILWVGIIILDYLNKQVIYIPSLKYFKYAGLFIVFGIVAAIISGWYNRTGFFKKLPTIPINGIVVFCLFLLSVCLITNAYNQYWRAPLDYTNYLHLIGKGIYTIGCSFLLVLGAYSVGNKCRSYFYIPDSRLNTFVLLDIALGFVVYTLLMMLLGASALLEQYILLAVLSLLILINYRESWWLIKRVLWEPFKRPPDFNFWGGVIAFFILVYITMNYFYTQAPFPLGFDARNYYVNVSRLISDAGALIPGFQPYAWGLVMSTGYIAFKSPEITMFISVLGGILSLFAIYHFCRRYLGISTNYSFLVVLLYLLTPTVTNHFIIEFKVDLSLLFIQITVINVLLWWLFESKKNKEDKSFLLVNKKDYFALATIGILLGFSLSIKVLSAFLIFGVFLALWWYKKDLIGVLGLSALGIGFILISGFDDLSGLRVYHKSPAITGFILFVLGLLAMGYSYSKSRKIFVNSFKGLIYCGIFCILPFAPWVYKNYTYTKSLSPTKLLIGEKPRPEATVREMIDNYEELKNENE